jgi:hypothetical protein
MTKPSTASQEVPEVERVKLDLAEIKAFASEDEFVALAVSLMVEVARYACIAANTVGTSTTWDRDHAAVGGNMVRLYKLVDAFLDQTCKRQGEISFIFARLIFETSVNVRSDRKLLEERDRFIREKRITP